MNRKQLCKFTVIMNFLYQDKVVKDKKVHMLENLIKSYPNDVLLLQGFIGEYLRLEFSWVTSLGIIDIADYLVKQAEQNGNL